MSDPFVVEVGGDTLTVSTDGGAVTAIRFGRHAARPAAAPFEREVARELAEYYAGERTAFDAPVAPCGTPFQKGVWAALREIPYGATRTYGEIARAVGQPGGSRAVGMANHRNPIPIMIPCHRVVAAGGRLGGFGGGLDRKRRLLALESKHSLALEIQS